MNITEEFNNIEGKYITTKSQIKGINTINWPTPNQVLEEKLKTTPYSSIKKISKSFNIDWNKIFKKILNSNK
jgi:hypothetical protein